MYSFNNDYSEGAHPEIIQEFSKTNEEQTAGYGLDIHTERATELIRDRLHNDNVDIHFLVGGTQTNLVSISAFLRPYHAVIAANTGHIATHETGAIEASGHKVLVADTMDGKLNIDLVDAIARQHNDEHMVMPKMVYISNPTELGTTYTRAELKDLYEYCKSKDFYLYIDGARLASALAEKGNDLLLSDYPELCDAFYIGGTKCGALFGEAVVIAKEELKTDFRYYMKQNGGLLAKGRLLGLQFEVLFRNNLYMKLGEHANEMARRLREGIASLGYVFMYDSNTNQIFPVFSDKIIEKLEKRFEFQIWENVNERAKVVRMVTSWATDENKVDEFLIYLAEATDMESK